MQSHRKTRHSHEAGTFHRSSVRAALKSNELSIGTERIMLLSIKAQAIAKDTRVGTCFLKDCRQYALLYEVMGRHVRCVCICDWHTGRPDAELLPGPGVELVVTKRNCSSPSQLTLGAVAAAAAAAAATVQCQAR